MEESVLIAKIKEHKKPRISIKSVKPKFDLNAPISTENSIVERLCLLKTTRIDGTLFFGRQKRVGWMPGFLLIIIAIRESISKAVFIIFF